MTNAASGHCGSFSRVFLLAALCSTTALAEEQQGTPSASLEEVVVTANKREESIRLVPLSLTAISSDALDEKHIQSFQDLSTSVPNLSFSSLGGEGLSNLEIRGISSQAGTATVAVYLDDISLSARNLYSEGAAEPRIFDLDRVEVLRGPQGTLYGASSLGGTIRFLTRQPSLGKFSEEAFAEGSNVKDAYNWTVRGIVNMPLVEDQFALRLGVETGTNAGYIKALPLDAGDTTTPNSNRSDWLVARPSALYKVNDALSIRASFFYQRYRSSDTDLVNLAAPDYVVTKGLREPSTDTLSIPSLTVNWDAGIGDLTSVTGFFHRTFDRTNDVTAANAQGLALGSISDPNVANAVFRLKSANYLDTSINQISEELRLASKAYAPGEFPLTWLVGSYYSNERTRLHDVQPIFGINNAFAQFGQDAQDPNVLSGAFPNDFANDLSYLAQRSYRTEQYAVFGEGTYHPVETVRLTAGLRYLLAREQFNSAAQGYYSSCDPSVNGPGCPITAHIDAKWHAVTPKFALGWDITPLTTLYSNITKGFRLGSENRPVPLYGDPNQDPNAPGANSSRADLKRLGLTSAPASYSPDSLWNFEVGTKSLFWDRTLAVDLSLFYIRWTSIQQTIALPTSGYDFEANAGDAKSYGVEMALNWKVNANLTLDASGGYTKATLDNGVVINGVRINNTSPGQDIAGVPRWSGQLGADVQHTFLGGEMFARADGNYVGKSHGTLVTTDPDYDRPGYVLVGGTLGYRRDAFDVSLFAKNLTDNEKIIQRPNIRNSGVNLAYRLAPRVIGVNARVSF